MDETVADATQVKYRCPCGVEFQVSANRGGNCPVCERRVSPSALEELVASTVSFVEFANLGRSVAAEDPQVDPWVGKQLGHFEVIERLGGGGMGAVYRALDRSLQRYVAVKLIRTSTDQAPEDKKVKALLQEAVAQARVHHPNVVTIYYVSHDQQTPFLAMVGGHARVVQDVPPYMLLDGQTGCVVGLNIVGLRRSGHTVEDVTELKAAYRAIYRRGLPWREVLEVLQLEFSGEAIGHLRTFLASGSRGFTQERRAPPAPTLRLRIPDEDDASVRSKAG